jgi:hypothetical protein
MIMLVYITKRTEIRMPIVFLKYSNFPRTNEKYCRNYKDPSPPHLLNISFVFDHLRLGRNHHLSTFITSTLPLQLVSTKPSVYTIDNTGRPHGNGSELLVRVEHVYRWAYVQQWTVVA